MNRLGKIKWITIACILVFVVLLFIGCTENQSNQQQNKQIEIPARESLIPANTVKMTPETDSQPVKSLSSEYEDPVPLPYPANTKGAEDSPFVMPEGNTIYIWFTPSPSIDVTKQINDKVTGIYKFEKQGSRWGDPERLWFVEPGTIHLDGCGFFSK